MTTTIKISAHCSNDKEVVIELTTDDAIMEQTVIQDTQEHTLYVYDGRRVSVNERLKLAQ